MTTQSRPSVRTRALAIRAHSMASMVWRKALANSTPSVRQMLLTYRRIDAACAGVPGVLDSPAEVSSHDLALLIGQAESALTDGFCQSMIDPSPTTKGD